MGQPGGGRENGKEPRACAWKEPVFSNGTDAKRRLPVAVRMTDWQAETYGRTRVRRGMSGACPVDCRACPWMSRSQNSSGSAHVLNRSCLANLGDIVAQIAPASMRSDHLPTVMVAKLEQAQNDRSRAGSMGYQSCLGPIPALKVERCALDDHTRDKKRCIFGGSR